MPFFVDKGVSSFSELSDTPGAIVANQAVRGNSTGTALEFYVPSGGGGGSSISDSTVSTTTTYSSSKIVTELATKANTSALNSYLPLAGGSLSGDVTTNVPNGSFTSTSLVTRNYVDTAVAGASAATTYTALTDTPSSHSANALLYSTGSAIAHTTTQIAIDGNNVEVNQLNARVDGTSNIGDSTHKFNHVFCGNIHQGNVKLVIPSTRGSTGQYVKVANANAEEHTLEFADVISDAAASSSTTYSSTKINTDLGGKVDKTSIQTLAEGDSSSESDVYSCNSVYSKNQINTSVTSQEVTVNNTSSLGRLNFGSNLTSGLYGTLQTYANGTRYSAMHHYATSGNCNIDWYLMKNNGETKMITIRPNDSEKVFEVLNGGIKAPIFQQRDSTTVIKIGQLDSASYGVPGIAIMPILNTVNSEFQMRGRRNTGILGDSYVYHQNGSTLTIQSRIQTNRHSTTHANIEVRTYQNGSETKVLDIGASSASAKTLTITGSTHGTGYFTTGETNFTANDQLVTKQFVDTSIANLVNSAPSTLDTLNELAAALGNDPNFATTVTNSLAGKLSLTGGSMTGQITTNQTVFNNAQQLVTKQYVDAQIVAGGGASQFTQLTDTPSSYTANRFLKSTGSGLDWFDLTSKTLTWDFYNALGDLPSASGNHGQIAHVHAEGAVYYAHNGSWVKLANDSRVDNSISNIALSGNDLSVTRQDGSAFLVVGVKPPQLSFAVQGGTVSNNGATLQLTQTNGTPAAITGLTPSTIADGKTLTSGTYDLGAGSIAITQQDATSITITGCPRPLSSFSAGAGSGNYYTPSFLNDRILPAVSSGTNSYVLGNDGSGPLWLSTLTAGSTTFNVGTSTLKKFATWAGSTFLEYFMKATPSNGDTIGSVAFSDTTLNNYATFSGKVDDNSASRQGHMSISTAKSGTMTEQLIVGKSDHSNADAGQFAGTLKVTGVKFSGNTTQTKPVEDPATVGHVLTAGAGGTWSWAAPSGGGGISPTYIDIHCQIGVATPSGATAITTGSSGSEALNTRWGVSWGKRYKTMFISQSGAPGWCYDGQDTLRADDWPRNAWGDHIQSMFNGNYSYNANGSATGPLDDDDYPPSFFVRYGYFDFKAPSQYRYNFSKLALYWNGTPSSSGSDYFKIFGSNDGVEFTELLHTTLQSGSSTTPAGYSVSQASGSATTVRWYNFTTTGFYRIYRHQWGEATNLDVVTSTTSDQHIFRFLTYSTSSTKVSLMEFEYH